MVVGSLSVVDRDDFEDVFSVILNGTEKLKILKVNGLGRLKKAKLCKIFKFSLFVSIYLCTFAAH